MSERPQNKNLVPWKKGQSGNPKGRPKTREDLKKVKLMKGDDVRRLIQKLLDMTNADLKAMVADPETPMMEMMIARVIVQGVSFGDQSKLNFLFDRTIGRALEHKEESKLVPVHYVTNISPDGRLFQEIMEEEDEEKNDAEM